VPAAPEAETAGLCPHPARCLVARANDKPAESTTAHRAPPIDPEDTAVLGDEAAVAKELQRYADAGATEFLFCPVGTAAEQERTIAFALGQAAAA
jgi:hypothetical protein